MFLDLWNRAATNAREDIEFGLPRKHSINGFPSAASFIANDPDHSFSVYCAFNQLSSRNLLYMEAELFELQKQQNDADMIDFRTGGAHAQECFRSWELLSNSTDEKQKNRVELIYTIRSKLKDYKEALVLEETVLKMGKPQSETVEALKLWLNGKSEGPTGRTVKSFQGLSACRLDDDSDLVALHPPFESDWLMQLAQLPYLRLLFRDSEIDESITLFSMRKMKRATAILSICIVAVLLIVSIVSLYVVQSPNTRLGLICGFTIAFTTSIHLLTNARRAELFASTAAYAAVLVVFVSGNLGSRCSSSGS